MSKQSAKEILLAVRDWGEGLAKQEFDDDPLPGMSPDQALQALSTLISEEVIGQNETEPTISDKQTEVMYIRNATRNNLRVEQRAKLQKVME